MRAQASGSRLEVLLPQALGPTINVTTVEGSKWVELRPNMGGPTADGRLYVARRCRFFHRGAGCNKGTWCDFSHSN